MEAAHLYALIPLLVFLIISLVFYGKGLVHLMTLGYTLGLAVLAVTSETPWEIVFFPVLAISGIIAILLFAFAMAKGDWL